MFRRQFTIYLLVFILALIAINYRSQKVRNEPLAEGIVRTPKGEELGKSQIIRRPDNSLALRISLQKALPKGSQVLIATEAGVFLSLGSMEGAAFIVTLPKSLRSQKIKGLRIIAPDGRVLAEARLIPIRQEKSETRSR